MIRRREFITLLGGAAAAWPLAARAQQPEVRTIGYLSSRAADVEDDFLAAFRRGLSETGHVEGRNLIVEYRWAEGRYDRLPDFAAELVRRQVSVIATTGGPQPARAALAATSTIPVVFTSGSDPVKDGLVKSLNRPGGNTTGSHVFTTSLGPKRLELLRELVPKAGAVGFLVNPSSQVAEIQVKEVVEAARSVGQQVHVLSASTVEEIEQAFVGAVQRGAGALLMSADLFFQVQRDQLVALAARHSLPVMYEWPAFVRAGGLISYSTFRTDAFLQSGIYVGRILNGAKVSDLPVVQSTRFELTINLKTAKALDLEIPANLLARADAVIE
jgi:putative tryptophan/tyrosine transport system substrate-binding protein